jgi:GH24 family phage-related lysozyme (muramidase)
MLASEQQITDTCITEEFSPTPYRDGQVNGVAMYSIGYGHQIQPNEQYLKRISIDRAKAMELLNSDILPIETHITNKMAYPLTQAQFDALFDFGYNEGLGSLNNILDTWNSTHDPDQVVSRMKLYTKYHDKAGNFVVSSDLVERRLQEGLKFLSTPFSSSSSTSLPLPAIIGGSLLLFLLFMFG